jgi:hypothetical protein
MEKLKIPKRKYKDQNLQNSYEAGWYSIMVGSNERTCHYSFFETAESKESWEKGREDAKEINPYKPYRFNQLFEVIE